MILAKSSRVRLSVLITLLQSSLAIAAESSPSTTSNGAPAASAAASAATGQPSSKGPAVLERVEIVGQSDSDDRRESTAAKIVVRKEDIARFGDTSLADVLRKVPGITVDGAHGRGGEVRMRGLGAGYTQILVNGEAVPTGFSLDSIAPSLIDRIEVLRTATAELSTKGIAGTINIVLKQSSKSARKELKGSVSESQGRLSTYLDGQYADSDGALSYALSGNANSERKLLRSRITQRATDPQGNVTLVRTISKELYEDPSSISLTPSLTWKRNENDSLKFDALMRHGYYVGGTEDLWGSEFGTPATFSSSSLVTTANTSLFRPRLQWKQRLAGEATIDTKLSASWRRRSSESSLVGRDSGATALLRRDVDSVATDTSVTIGGTYRVPYASGHTLTLGWDGEQSRRVENRDQREIAVPPLVAENLVEDYVAQVRRLAMFVQDEWDVIPRVSAYAGLRWEGLQTLSVGSTLAGVRNTSSVLSPVLQALWKIPDSKADQVRVGLSRTYKAPDTRDLLARRWVVPDNTPTTPNYEGNPDLRPELAWGLDVAYERHFAGDGLLSINAFRRLIDDVILEELRQVNGVWVTRSVNNGRARVGGIELEGKVSVAKLIQDAPKIDIRANVVRNWSRVEAISGPGNRLESQIPLSANLGVDYRRGALTTGINLGVQKGVVVRKSETQSIRIPTKRATDLYALWAIDAKAKLRFAASNLLHRDHITEESYADSLGTYSQHAVEDTAPTIRLTLELDLR